MVDVYIPEIEFNRNRLEQYYETTKVGTLDVLGATLEDTFYYNPTSAADRFLSMKLGSGQDGNLLTPDQYKESQYYREGLEAPPEGIKEGYAQLLADNYDKRAKIQQTLSRSKGGFALGAAQFGTMLVGSVLDPLNVASAFIPVFPAARYSHLVAKYGLTKARAVKGVVEGSVGATIVEPIVLGQAYVEQDKSYNLLDSFLNVTVGGALGGGLHVGFGRISDIIERRSQIAKETALITSVKQMMSDQDIEVTPIMKADLEKTFQENLKKQNKLDSTKPQKIEDIKRTSKKKLPDSVNVEKVKKPKSLLQFIKENGRIKTTDPLVGDIAQVLGARLKKDGKPNLNKENTKFVFSKNGVSVEEMTLRVQEAGYFLDKTDMDYGINNATTDDLINLLDKEQRGDILYSKAEEDVYQNFIATERRAQEIDELGIDPTNMTEEELQLAVDIQLNARQTADDVAISETEEMQNTNTIQEIDDLKAQQIIEDFNLGNLKDYDEYVRLNAGIDDTFDLNARISELDKEIEYLEADFENTSSVLRDEDLEIFKQNIKNADELIEKADQSYKTATETAASCIMRNTK